MDSSCLIPMDEVSCGWNWMGLLLRILHHIVAHAILEQPPTGCCCFLVAKSCLTLCNHIDCNPPGSSVLGTFQARILEWVAISFSRGSFRLRDPGIEPASPASEVDSLPLSHLGSPPTVLSIIIKQRFRRVGVQPTGDTRKLSGVLALEDSSAQQAWQDSGKPGVGLNGRGLAWKPPLPCLLDLFLSTGWVTLGPSLKTDVLQWVGVLYV